MSQYQSTPDFNALVKDLKARIQALENAQTIRTYTTATRPPSSKVTAGTVIYVSDGGAGNVFQGWNGSGWVSLG